METTTLQVGKNQEHKMLQSFLLSCGIFSSLLYAAMNIFVPMMYPGYSSASYTVSELSAIDAPTRTLWVTLAGVYSLLVVAFGLGIWKSASQKRTLRIAGILLIIYILIGLAWPPMHQREILAANGGTMTDTLHIVFTIVTVILMLLIIGLCAVSFGKKFRWYSIATILILLVFGALTGLEAPKLEANLPTPWMGVWERISIGAYMLWIAVLAVAIMHRKKT